MATGPGSNICSIMIDKPARLIIRLLFGVRRTNVNISISGKYQQRHQCLDGISLKHFLPRQIPNESINPKIARKSHQSEVFPIYKKMLLILCTVISVIMPPLSFTVNMPPLFLTAVFSFFLGRRCLVEGLVSAPAHPLPPPKNMSTTGQIHQMF